MDKLVVENLSLDYGAHRILNGVSFELRPGEIVSLLGASGSGKTSLLRAVAGLEHPSGGRIELDGRVFFDRASRIDVPAEERMLSLVFQSYALWPHRTVAENVGYGLKLRRVAARERSRRIRSVLERLGLGQLAERFPHQLSGGQQQRVAIARALVYNPPVILLDEPLSNLDAKLREEARAWLRDLIVSLGLSALCVTHDQTEAMAISDRILLLRNGKIEQEGTPAELYGAPRSLYAAEFMGSNNRIEARVRSVVGNRVALGGDGWELDAFSREPLQPGQDARLVIRLENVLFAEGPGANRLRAKLVASTYLGGRWEYVLEHSGLRLRAFGSEVRAKGVHWIELPSHHCWAFGTAD